MKKVNDIDEKGN